MWAFLEVVGALLQLLSLLPPPKAGQQAHKMKPLPGWVRWPIYGVILLGLLTLVGILVVLLLV